jgi:hypothetical protein
VEPLPNSTHSPITGIVVPDSWDDHGHVIGVSIQAYDEREYAVGQNAWGKRLLGLTRKKIRAWGRISQLPAGKLGIQVDQVEVIEH